MALVVDLTNKKESERERERNRDRESVRELPGSFPTFFGTLQEIEGVLKRHFWGAAASHRRYRSARSPW